MWCIPPKANGEFVWKMEDVLEVYKRPYDPLRPVVCMDETSKQLIAETRLSEDPKPGRARRVDYEYERKGVADLFLFFEPLRGWRRVWITPRRRKVDANAYSLHVEENLNQRQFDLAIDRVQLHLLDLASQDSRQLQR